jgi:hypothetical protein
MSAREIPGYKNPLTGKSVAMIERLSCSHEYVDGKFNVDSLYFSTPRAPQLPTQNIVLTPQMLRHQYKITVKSNKSIGVMDVLCAVCLIFLVVTVPPLAIVPAIYFIFRRMMR